MSEARIVTSVILRLVPRGRVKHYCTPSGQTPVPGPQPVPVPTTPFTAAGTMTPNTGETLVSIAAQLCVSVAQGSASTFTGSPASIAAAGDGTVATPYSFTFSGFNPAPGQSLSVVITAFIKETNVPQVFVTPLSFETAPQVVSSTLGNPLGTRTFNIIYGESMGSLAFSSGGYKLIGPTGGDVTASLSVAPNPGDLTSTNALFTLNKSLPGKGVSYTLRFSPALANLDGVPISPPQSDVSFKLTAT